MDFFMKTVFGLNLESGQINKVKPLSYDAMIYISLCGILNSQYFWKWTNANTMKIIGQDATASKL